MLQISKAIRVNRTTVRKYLTTDTFPERGRHSVPPSILVSYQKHLKARWSEGERSALAIYREIQALGYTGSVYVYGPVRWVTV